MRSKIIAFAGRKRSGKGMLAQGACNFDKANSVIVTIADNLKYLCCELLNVTYRELNRMKDEEKVIDVTCDGRWVSIISRETCLDDEIICKEIGGRHFTNVREILQVVGTDLIRKYVPDWHIDKTIERVNEFREQGKTVIIDDMRFPNEKCKIEKMGGAVFFVIRPNNWEVSNHPSEKSLSYKDFETNRVIINDFPKEDMINYFNSFYFEDEMEELCPILLFNNKWYSDNVMDTETPNCQLPIDRDTFCRYLIGINKKRPLFIKNGIITYNSETPKYLKYFRRIILNDRHETDDKHYFALYNPLTNEILKNYF